MAKTTSYEPIRLSTTTCRRYHRDIWNLDRKWLKFIIWVTTFDQWKRPDSNSKEWFTPLPSLQPVARKHHTSQFTATQASNHQVWSEIYCKKLIQVWCCDIRWMSCLQTYERLAYPWRSWYHFSGCLRPVWWFKQAPHRFEEGSEMTTTLIYKSTTMYFKNIWNNIIDWAAVFLVHVRTQPFVLVAGGYGWFLRTRGTLVHHQNGGSQNGLIILYTLTSHDQCCACKSPSGINLIQYSGPWFVYQRVCHRIYLP